MNILSDAFTTMLTKIEVILVHLNLEKIRPGIYMSNDVMVSFNDNALRILCDENIILFKEYLIQRQFTSGDLYRSDTIFLPSSTNTSFYDIKTEEEFFQLCTIEDLSYLTFKDLETLNTLREYVREL